MPAPNRFASLSSLAPFAAIVASSTWIGFELRGDGDPISLFWPGNGFVLAFLLARPRSEWPLLVVATGAAVTATGWAYVDALPPYSIVSTIEPLIAAILLGGVAPISAKPSRLESWLRLIVCGPGIAAAAGGALGALMLSHAEPQHGFLPLMRSWWAADALGMILVTPATHALLVAFHSRGSSGGAIPNRIELGAFVAVFVAFSALIFGFGAGTARLLDPLEHAILPILLWAALRFPWWVSLNAMLVYCGIAAWQTAFGAGAFDGPGSQSLGGVMAFQASALTNAIGVQLALTLAIERRTSSEILARSDRRFRDVLESTNEWLWEVDLSSRFVYSSAHCLPLLGYTAEELIGTDATALVFPDDLPHVMKAFEDRVVRGLPIQSVIHRDRRKDGGTVYLESNVVPVFDDEGRVVGGRGMDRDVSERIAAQEDARRLGEAYAQSEKLAALGALVSGVAHEVNNPNQFIALNMPIVRQAWKEASPAIEAFARDHADWTLTGLPPKEAASEIGEAIEEVIQGSERIRSIVSELRDFLRGEPAHVREPVDPGACVGSVRNLVAGAIAARAQRLDVEVSPGLPTVRGHRQRLEQVLINLISNASEALEGKPGTVTLRVRASEDGRSVTFEVKDDGIGIPQTDLGRVMDPFFTTKRSTGGMGLGLAICSRIAQEHEGRLELHSKPGEGTTARLVLPAAP